MIQGYFFNHHSIARSVDSPVYGRSFSYCFLERQPRLTNDAMEHKDKQNNRSVFQGLLPLFIPMEPYPGPILYKRRCVLRSAKMVGLKPGTTSTTERRGQNGALMSALFTLIYPLSRSIR